MNDPLRDNRIFPEEMHEQPVTSLKQPMNLTWLWTILIILALAALVWFGYQYYQKNMQPEPAQVEETVLPTPQAQQEAIDSVTAAAPEMNRVERQEKINTLFGN